MWTFLVRRRFDPHPCEISKRRKAHFPLKITCVALIRWGTREIHSSDQTKAKARMVRKKTLQILEGKQDQRTSKIQTNEWQLANRRSFGWTPLQKHHPCLNMAFSHVHVVLVEPALSQNVGACCRALNTFGLSSLRLVTSRKVPHSATATATMMATPHSQHILNSCKM